MLSSVRVRATQHLPHRARTKKKTTIQISRKVQHYAHLGNVLAEKKYSLIKSKKQYRQNKVSCQSSLTDRGRYCALTGAGLTVVLPDVVVHIIPTHSF